LKLKRQRQLTNAKKNKFDNEMDDENEDNKNKKKLEVLRVKESRLKRSITKNMNKKGK